MNSLLLFFFFFSLCSLTFSKKKQHVQDYSKIRPTFFLQYYTWWKKQYNVPNPYYEQTFVDRFKFSALGLPEFTDCRPENPGRGAAFDLVNFQYIRKLGFDALSWQMDAGGTLPPVDLLEKADLKVAPFLDLVIAVKHALNESMRANVPSFVLEPSKMCKDLFLIAMRPFFSLVPPHLRARDGKGRIAVYVFFFKWEMREVHDASVYDQWAEELLVESAALLGERPTFYVLSQFEKDVFLAHLFLRHREYFVPFNFVSDYPQGHYGHDSVTWNFGFDNHGVQMRDGLQRAIKVDPRYVTEQAWLAAGTNPAAVFVYSWNEPFESSMLFPTQQWGDVKARVASYYIRNFDSHQRKINLPKTLIIVNDFPRWLTLSHSQELRNRANLQRHLIENTFRHLAPHADLRTDSELSRGFLSQYEILLDFSLVKTNKTAVSLIANSLKNLSGFLMEPCPLNSDPSVRKLMCSVFFEDGECKQTERFDSPKNTEKWIAKRGDDMMVSMKFLTSLKGKIVKIFPSFYGPRIPIGTAITFTRRKVTIEEGNVTVNYYDTSHASAIGNLPLPSDVDWYRPLAGLPGDLKQRRKIEKFAYNL